MLRYDISSTIHVSFRVAYFEWYAVASAAVAAVIVAVVAVVCFSRFICRLLLALQLQLHRLNPKYECDSDFSSFFSFLLEPRFREERKTVCYRDKQTMCVYHS